MYVNPILQAKVLPFNITNNTWNIIMYLLAPNSPQHFVLSSHYHQSDRGATETERDTTGTKRWGSGTAQVQRGRLLVRSQKWGSGT